MVALQKIHPPPDLSQVYELIVQTASGFGQEFDSFQDLVHGAVRSYEAIGDHNVHGLLPFLRC